MIQPSKRFPYDDLSVAERILLAQDIWDSIAAEQENVLITQAQRDELNRRLAEHRASPAAAMTWDEVKINIRARLQERRTAS